MTKIFIRALCICLATLALPANGQQLDQRLEAIYSNLTGTWTGQAKDFTKHPAEVIPLRIEIKREDDQGRLRWDYFYGSPAKRKYKHQVRFLKIDPDKQTVSFDWSKDRSLMLRSEDLDEVLRNGVGEFRVFLAESVYADKILHRATFHLMTDRLEYLWQEALEGEGFKPTAQIIVLRVVNAEIQNWKQPQGPPKF